MGSTSLGGIAEHPDNHVNDIFGIDQRIDTVARSTDPAVALADGSRIDEHQLHE